MYYSDDGTLPFNVSVSDVSELEEELTSVPFDPELKYLNSSSDDDDGDEVQISSAAPAQSSFSLKGGSFGFSSRSHSIFECLDGVAKLASPVLGQDRVFALPPPPLTSSKTGQPPPSSSGPLRRRGVPDYLVHPDRWTHYNLEDVAETSNHHNSIVAQQFLASLRQSKLQQEPVSSHLNQGQNTCSQQKIIFSSPSRLGREPLVDETKAAGGREWGMSLSHLEEEEKEEGVDGGRSMSKRMNVFEKSVEKAKERGKGISHLDQEDEEMRAATRTPGAEERKRKWGKHRGGDEEEEKKKKNQQANPGIFSFRKTNRKNYRKSSEQDHT